MLRGRNEMGASDMKILAAALLLVAGATSANAAVLYQNSVPNSTPWCSDCEADYGVRSWAFFSLADDAILQSASFRADLPNATGNSVSIWSVDQSTQLYTLDFTGSSGPLSVNLPDWSLSAGSYLLSVYNAAGLFWYGSTGPGGYQTLNGDVYPNRAYSFTIEGELAVPEPAMLALFGLGALGVGLRRRRRT